MPRKVQVYTFQNVLQGFENEDSAKRSAEDYAALVLAGDIIPHLNSSVTIRAALTSLATLRLLNVQLEEMNVNSFQNMGTLESLTISQNNLSDLQPLTFLGLYKLYRLDLSDNGLKYLASGIFEGLRELRYLDLRKNRIAHVHFGMFHGLRRHGKFEVTYALVVLDLTDNLITKIDDLAFVQIPFLKELRIWFPSSDIVLPEVAFEGLSGLRRLIIRNSGWFPVRKSSMRGLHSRTHLHANNINLPNIQNRFFADSLVLQKLIICNGQIRHLEHGCFFGLSSLHELDLADNRITHLSDLAFEDLVSLRVLNMTSNDLQTIEEKAFQDLKHLLFLDLSFNKLRFLRRNTFSDLVRLREVSLKYHEIKVIEPGAFSGLFSLKVLRMFYSNVEDPLEFASMHRLDIFEGSGYILSPGLDVMSSLHLIGRNALFNDLGKWLRNVKYFRDSLRLVIYLDPSHLYVQSAPEFHIYLLDLIFVTVVRPFSFMRVPELKQLIIRSITAIIIHREAFRNLHHLEYLKIESHTFKLETHVFEELYNLQVLTFVGNFKKNKSELTLSSDLFKGLRNLKELAVYAVGLESVLRATFLELESLEILSLINNVISEVHVGAFFGLEKIRTIKLAANSLSSIGYGVFGALCPDNFTLTCANLTRVLEFCNTSFALRTLKHLDLDNNQISSIHPHAFLGCDSLQTLSLLNVSILKVDFLYTPELRTLDLKHTNISKILNISFSCTPKLSSILIHFNSHVEDIDSYALQHLRNLELVHLPNGECSCSLRRVWALLRDRHVEYHFHPNVCSGEHIDIHFSKLVCNASSDLPDPPSNKSSTTDDHTYFQRYIEPIVLIFIFLSGCFGNGLLLFIILRHSDMRNKNNACVVHLAIADLLSLILNLPLSYWDTVHITWELGETTCKTFIMAKDLVVALVVFTVLALSFERFLVLYTSFKLRAACGFSARPVIFLGVVWTFALVSSIPSYMMAYNASAQGRCLSFAPGVPRYLQRTWTFQLLMYCLVPVSSILFLNILTAYNLKTSIRKAPGVLHNEIRERNRNSVANIVVVLSAVFTLSYVPSFLLRALIAWAVVNIAEVFWYAFVTYSLFFFHTVFSPFAFFTMGSKYKSHILKYVRFFINRKEDIVLETRDVKLALETSGRLLLKLGECLIGNEHCSNEVASDEAVRRARLERLKRLQSCFYQGSNTTSADRFHSSFLNFAGLQRKRLSR